MASFPVVLDACVLYPLLYRDFLLYAGLVDPRLYEPVWSDEILDEMSRNLIADGRITAEKAQVLAARMNRAFPDARRNPPADLIAAMTNDPKDRHVLATAVLAGAEVIVTDNLVHFPEEGLKPYGIEAQSPDKFLQHLLSLNRGAVVAIAQRLIAQYRRPPFTAESLIQALADKTPGFAYALGQAFGIPI